MVTEIQYTNIRRILDDINDHPLMKDVTLEQAVRHTIRFISLHGFPKFYQDKEDTIEIKDFRGLLPSDLISITQIKDLKHNVCLRAMTDTFTPEEDRPLLAEDSFKTQGRVIFTSFKDGEVELAYKAIPVDDDGFPLLIDNEVYLNALEAYIKVRVFTVKFDTGKIAAGVLSNAQTEYSWVARQLQQEFVMPSMSEMESITRMWNTMLKSTRQFDNGFKSLGNREYIRKH